MMNIASFSRLHKLNSKQIKDCVLINEVKKFTFLYDRNEMNHKRAKFRQAAWDEIGAILGMDGIDCMNRWKVLRERYRKEKKMTMYGTLPGAKKWLYYDLCTFLDPYLDDIKPFSKVLDEVMNEEMYSAAESVNDSSQEGFEQSDDQQSDSKSPRGKSTSFNPPSSQVPSAATLSVASLNDPSPTTPAALVPPSTFIRIIVPPAEQPPTTSTSHPKRVKRPRSERTLQPSTSYPRKYVKILPKGNPPSQTASGNGIEETSNDDSADLSQYKDPDKLDTVDHLMTFMGNTIKQLSARKQRKMCQELTAAFFSMISNEEEEDD